MITCFTVQTPDGISWYCERQGDNGPNLVLIPSGEGDCFSFRKTAAALADRYQVLTFDMPGMSHTSAPESCYQSVTAQRLADQVVSLMDQLHIPTATFYGCSSGGATVLALVANHPTRVQSGIVHEVPYTVPGMLAGLLDLSDSEIVETCGRIFSSDLCEDRAAFDALGEEYQSRLNGNYVTWVRNYDGTVPASLTFADEDLKRRPLTWTLGALTPTGAFFANVGVAQRLGVTIRLLPSKHFPQITIPEQLAEHIAESASTFL